MPNIVCVFFSLALSVVSVPLFKYSECIVFTFPCIAFSSRPAMPIANKTFINLIAVRPLSVDILLNNQPLSSDRMYDIECQAIGSKPTAKITWWMNGVQLRSFREKVCRTSY